MLVKWITGFLLSAAGANLVLRVLNRLDLSQWYALVKATCHKVSRAGNAKFTKPIYEPFETFFQGILAKTIEAANKGFDSDDSEQPQGETK